MNTLNILTLATFWLLSGLLANGCLFVCFLFFFCFFFFLVVNQVGYKQVFS